MEREGFGSYIKRSILQMGMTGKLIAINTGVFLLINILSLIGRFFIVGNMEFILLKFFYVPPVINSYLVASPDGTSTILLGGLLQQPWTVFTYMFSHSDILHFLMNMIVLYFSGRLFGHFLGHRKMLLTYIFGGIAGYLLQLLCFSTIPYFQTVQLGPTIGASGAIMAVFVAVAFNQPRYSVRLFGMFPVTLILLAGIYMLIDFSLAGSGGRTAHIVHLGGAVFGGLSVIRVASSKNFMNRFERWLWAIRWPSLWSRKKEKFAYEKSAAAKMKDDDYNFNKKKHQERIDAILDKISKKGYDGLTKEEKQILFDESKRK